MVCLLCKHNFKTNPQSLLSITSLPLSPPRKTPGSPVFQHQPPFQAPSSPPSNYPSYVANLKPSRLLPSENPNVQNETSVSELFTETLECKQITILWPEKRSSAPCSLSAPAGGRCLNGLGSSQHGLALAAPPGRDESKLVFSKV